MQNGCHNVHTEAAVKRSMSSCRHWESVSSSELGYKEYVPHRFETQRFLSLACFLHTYSISFAKSSSLVCDIAVFSLLPSFARVEMAFTQMARFHAQMSASSEGDGGLNKLNIGGSKPTRRAKKADGGTTNWDPTGTLTKPPKRLSAH
ncbi:hypothetical protein KC19_12G016800 [Ceratodon purpureus]|uniref:Uncharacterized protein n=1 Tax=Ceratodon purpureus TaxID=3225 RepID=A0A8T0G2G4_CERPU|nr:hypothetical protein KC19_12G016800 [Ceratodon purpureus]